MPLKLETSSSKIIIIIITKENKNETNIVYFNPHHAEGTNSNVRIVSIVEKGYTTCHLYKPSRVNRHSAKSNFIGRRFVRNINSGK